MSVNTIPSAFGTGGSGLNPTSDPVNNLQKILSDHATAINTLLGTSASTLSAAVVVAVTNIALSGTQTIDGVGVVAGNRVLVTAQSTAANNGIYIVAAGAWTRSTDFNSSTQMLAGLLIPVFSGSMYGGSIWEFITVPPIGVGSTTLTFKQSSGSATNPAVLGGVKVVAVTNIALSGTQTIDGVGVVASDRVFAAAQTDATTNGIYIVAAGAWTRSTDFATASQMATGMLIPIYAGSIYAGSVWEFTATGTITVGTSNLTFLQVGPPTFGSDTVVQLSNASSTLVKALELIASLTTNTPGSEVSQWVVKLLSAGAQVSAYILGTLGLTVPNGSTTTPSINFAGSTNSGIYRQGPSDNRLIDAGTGVLKWSSLGIQLLVNASAVAWANSVGMAQGGPNNANLILTGAATGNAEVGAAGALATNATAGFLSPPSCAGTPTGTVANVSTGKIPMVVDTTGNKIWFQVSAGVWKGVAIA